MQRIIPARSCDRLVRRFILARHEELDGNFYELLTPAATVLSEKQPLAATILLRAMIGFSLDRARSRRYKHAVRHLIECEALAKRIENFAGQPTHNDYLITLRKRHGKKSGFWSMMN